MIRTMVLSQCNVMNDSYWISLFGDAYCCVGLSLLVPCNDHVFIQAYVFTSSASMYECLVGRQANTAKGVSQQRYSIEIVHYVTLRAAYFCFYLFLGILYFSGAITFPRMLFSCVFMKSYNAMFHVCIRMYFLCQCALVSLYLIYSFQIQLLCIAVVCVQHSYQQLGYII